MAKHGTTEAQKAAQEKRAAYKLSRTALREANLKARAARSPQQQLDRLDTLLGKGQGARKERARLAKQIKNS